MCDGFVRGGGGTFVGWMSAPQVLKEPVEAARAALSIGRGLFMQTDQEGEFYDFFLQFRS